LSFKDANTLLESGGGYGRSVIQYLNAADMKVLKKQGLDNDYFGEGCELLSNGQNGNNVYQMTYRENKV
jgi:glutamine cyclotransferase